MGFEVLRGCDGADVPVPHAGQGPVRRGQEVRPFEPPVPEQLGVERRHDHAASHGRFIPGEAL